jgi:hypothetical protein
MTNLDDVVNQVFRVNEAVEQKIRQMAKGKKPEYELEQFIAYIKGYKPKKTRSEYTPANRRVPKLNKSEYRENKNQLERVLLTYFLENTEPRAYTINSLKTIPGTESIAKTTHSLSSYVRAISREQGWITYNRKTEEYLVERRAAKERAKALGISFNISPTPR